MIRITRRQLERAREGYVEGWLLDTWGYATGWTRRLAEMILWYSAAGSGHLGMGAADAFLALVRAGHPERLPLWRPRTWREARRFAGHLCGENGGNPVDWFTRGRPDLEAAWRRLQAVPGVKAKIASWVLRDLSLLRDYSTGGGGPAVKYRRRRDMRRFGRLSLDEQALFLPIDRYVYAGARRQGVSPALARHGLDAIQARADLHRQAAMEMAAWARARAMDPRDLDVYWYSLGAGAVHAPGPSGAAQSRRERGTHAA